VWERKEMTSPGQVRILSGSDTTGMLGKPVIVMGKGWVYAH
jgi:hypothetical protein